jgi:hypothetical protein
MSGLVVRLPDEVILASALRIPEHVVCRDFVSETVVLNLKTAQYHGLNPTGALMLRMVTDAQTVGQTIPEIAAAYRKDPAEVRPDVLRLIHDLMERDLLEVCD